MADDRDDHPSNAQTQRFGAGKDVLFGWLVGRAAADLGLAQVIAASEAQRNEQLKRLEESLLAQLQQLNKQQGAADDAAIDSAGIDELKAEIQNFTERLGWVESATQQTHHLGDTLKAEIASVENQIAGQQSRIESGNANFEQLEQSIGAKVRELEQQMGAAPSALDNLKAESGEVRSQLQSLADRVIGCELLAGTALTRAELEAERWRWTAEIDERVTTRTRELVNEIRDKIKVIDAIKLDQEAGAAELARLVQRLAVIEAATHEAAGESKAELGAQREASRSREGERKAAEKQLRERLDGLEQKLGAGDAWLREQWESAAKCHRQELDGLVARIEAIAKNVSDSKAADDAEQMRWKKAIDESFAARLVVVEDSLKDLRRLDEKQSVDDGDLKLAMHTLKERMAKMEFAAQQVQAMSAVDMRRAEQTAATVKSELTSFQGEVGEQFRKFHAPEVLLTALDEKFARKFDAVQSHIAQARQNSDDQAHHIQEFRSELQTLLRRISEAEAGAHQIHALMVNEREQNAQLRDTLRDEHEALRAQLGASRPNDMSLRDLDENFRRQIGALENQLSQRLRLLEQRDADFRELRPPDQIIDQRVAEISTPVAAIAPLAPLTAAATVGIDALRVEEEAAASSIAGKVHNRRQDATAELLESPLSEDILNSGNRDQLKQLQERISADIERARNELREKSGRWKVRR